MGIPLKNKKMKIAIDTSPLQTGHRIRGTGFYVERLKNALTQYHPEYEYMFFQHKNRLNTTINLVHYPYFDPFFITLPFRKQFKTVVTILDLIPIVFPEQFPAGIKGNVKWQIQKLLAKQTDAIITISESAKKDIVRHMGIGSEKITVIYLAAGSEFKKIKNHESRIKEIRKKYNLPERFALYVGDVTWNKNLPRLVKAVQKTKIPLVMVGKALTSTDFDKTNPWNKDLVEVQRIIKEDNNIISLGFVPTEELITLYNIAALFIFPSLYEGFGLPILEAMQCGCPVITTKESSLPEVAGDSAIYVDAYESDSIAKGLQKVFTNTKLQKELSMKG